MQTVCASGDGCCPAGCTVANDADCGVKCGNGIIDSGETCDGNCPTACPAMNCRARTLTGSAATCDAQCVDAGVQTACVNKDGCCPAGCTTVNDSDCVAACGNGVLEGAETCESSPASPLCAAITCDDKDACTVDSRQGMDVTCNVACGHSQITGCIAGARDGCCAAGCNATNDPDCAVVCGNGIVEAPTESCDTKLAGSCPTVCPQAACVLPDLVNAGTCKAACVDQGRRQTTCVAAAKDGCCPAGCNATNDADCVPACGNGVIEAGETCESKAPATPLCTNVSCNDNNACTTDGMTGSAAACNLVCTHAAVTACSLTRDGCCPSSCNATNDADCGAVCGNGVLETGETCETKGPATPLCANVSCNDNIACTTDGMTGSAATCNLACTHTAIAACRSGDGCCPTGCNAVNDTDCPAVCNNGVLEPGETCNLACGQHVAITTCSLTSDGCCPSGCTGVNDADCAPSNDTCAGALDISAGGDFAFSLVGAKTDFGAATSLKCGLGTGADVFFTFTLATSPTGAAPPSYYAYFDVFDANGNAVNVALELYAGSCQTADPGNPTGCASSTSGMTGCTTAAAWPRLLSTVTAGMPYILVARVASGTGGRYTLRFHRVPTACAGGGALLANATPSTCQTTDLYGSTCGSAALVGAVNYYYEKCPAGGLTVDTCGGRAANSDTVLQINEGSVDLNLSTGKCTVKTTATTVCNDTSASCGSKGPLDATLTNVERGERGLFTVVVGSVGTCSPVTLTSSSVP